MLNPVALSIIVSVFTDRRERARAVGVWGSAIGIPVAAGPVLGGLLVTGIGWRSVFWVNVPIGIAAIALTRRFVPESRAARARAFDPPGEVLIIAAFASVIAATRAGARPGWAAPWTVARVPPARPGAAHRPVRVGHRRDDRGPPPRLGRPLDRRAARPGRPGPHR